MRFLVSLLLSAMLAACVAASPVGGQATRSYSFTPPDTPGGRMCIHQCSEAQDYCRQNCDLKDRACTNAAQARAIDDYDKYTREQFESRQDIDLYPSDFERTKPCVEAKDKCYGECENRYRMCYQDCGGHVSAVSSCQSFCY